MKHRSAPTTNRRVFFPPSPALLFFLIPPRSFCSPASTWVSSPRKSKRRVTLVWEMVRARPGAVQGESETGLRMTTACCRAGPRGAGSSSHRREPEHIISEGRVSELQFNKPSTAPLPIPGKLINAVGCHGSVCLRETGSPAALRSTNAKAAPPCISPASSSAPT